MCFVNFGMLEMYFVVVLDVVLCMCGMLILFEGVVIGVVDGYVCIVGWLVVVLLYLGFGLGNGLVNLYNVCCVWVLMVVVVGDYVIYYKKYDVLLEFDIDVVVGIVLGWVCWMEVVVDVGVDVEVVIVVSWLGL